MYILSGCLWSNCIVSHQEKEKKWMSSKLATLHLSPTPQVDNWNKTYTPKMMMFKNSNQTTDLSSQVRLWEGNQEEEVSFWPFGPSSTAADIWFHATHHRATY